MVPDPSKGIITSLDTSTLGVFQILDKILDLVTMLFIGGHPSGTDKENISHFKGDTLGGGDLIEFLDGDLDALKGIIFGSVFGSPSSIIEEHGSASNASTSSMMDTQTAITGAAFGRNFGGIDTIIELTRVKMCNVT
jgi:hypothetical protein